MSAPALTRTSLRAGQPSPFDLAFWVVWVVAVAALAVGGDRFDLVQGVIVAAVFAGLYALTCRFTDPAVVSAAPRNTAAAAVVVALIIALTTAETLSRSTSSAVGAWWSLHLWLTGLVAPFVRVLDFESLDNTVRYVVVPGLVLVVLGWRARDFGFGPARRGMLRALVLWSVLPIVLYGTAAIVMGHGKPLALAHRFFIDVFRNGYAEEILYRGMLLRLTASAFGASAGNVAQALVFGFWHLGADLPDAHGVVWLALADAFGTQAIAGYFFGLLTLRTGNLVAAGAAHALYDGGAIFV